MRITFRQGIIRHQTDILDNPTFLDLSSGKVSLIVSPDPTIITFANGTSTNYLYTESNSVSDAWPGAIQPSHLPTISTFSAGTDYWLYWDLNRTTGIRSFGHTLLEPIVSANAPSNPQPDQHWFDLTRRTMFVRQNSRWVEKVRVFATKLDEGAVFTSLSAQAPQFTGTQAGLTIPGFAGSLIFDSTGIAIRTSQNKFFTTEDVFLSGVPTGTEAKINAVLVSAEAQQPIAAYTIVQFSAFDRIIPASPFTSPDAVWGIIEEDVVTGEPVRVVMNGIIRNTAWDFTSVGVNTLVYFNSNGKITTTQNIVNQFPIGFVIDKNAIVLRQPRTFIENFISAEKATQVQYGTVRLSTHPASAGDPIAVGDNDPRLANTLGSPLPLQPGDNVSELVNDVGYLTTLGSPLPLFPGDNVSELVNDVGYLTSLALNDLTDVTLGSPVTPTYVLTFNGTVWEAQAASGGDGGIVTIYAGTDISVANAGSPLAPTVSVNYPLDEAPDGTALTPTYSFANETNSGWYRDSTQNVCLAVGGAEAFCVVSRAGSPLPFASGSPDVLAGIDIDFHVKNDGEGDAQIRIETDAANASGRLQLTTANGTWGVINDASDDSLHLQWNDIDQFVVTNTGQLSITLNELTDITIGSPIDTDSALTFTGSEFIVRKFYHKESITATGSPLQATVTHNIGQQFVLTQVYDNSAPPQQVDPILVELVDANTVRFTFGAAITGTAVIMGLNAA